MECKECGSPLRYPRGAGRGLCSRCYQAEYRAANSDKINTRRQRWRELPETIERERSQRKIYRLRDNHGLTRESLAALLVSQQGRCYLCGDPLALADVEIEHDHRCCPKFRSCERCRRGLSCHMCNKVASFSRDDPRRLRVIAKNLEAAIDAVTERIGR